MNAMKEKGQQVSCRKCTTADTSEMVMCDRCDQWYHYRCAGVDENIANESWICENCAPPQPPNAEVASTRVPTTVQSAPLAVRSAASTLPGGDVPMASSSPTTTASATLSTKAIATFSNTAPKHHHNHHKHNHNYGEYESQQHVSCACCHDQGYHTEQHQSMPSIPQHANVAETQRHQFVASIPQHPNVADIQQHQRVASITQHRPVDESQQHQCAAHQHQHAAETNQRKNVNTQQHDCNACIPQHVYNVHQHQNDMQSCLQQHVYSSFDIQQVSTTANQMLSDLRQPNLYSNAGQHSTDHVSQNLANNVSQPHRFSQHFRNDNSQPNMCSCRRQENIHCCNSRPPNHQNVLPNCNVMAVPTPSQVAARQVLPKHLPNFDGNPEEWPLFISAFENSTAMGGYNNAENLVRLQACLKGRARETVRSRLLLPTMVPDVIKTLQMCFGRPDLILDSLVEKVRKVPPIREKLGALIDLALCVRNICATMESCGMVSYMHNPILVRELIEKLPSQHKLDWAKHVKHTSGPVVQVFSNWLYSIAEDASTIISSQPLKRHGIVNAHYHTPEDEPTRRSTDECTHCSSTGHRISQCQIFKGLSIAARWDFIRNKRLCCQCLNAHRRRCFSKRLCGVSGCTARHHQLLHKPTTAVADVPSDRTMTDEKMLNSHNARETSRNFFRILPVSLHHKNKILKTHAFLDEGSSVTLLDKSVFNALGLQGENDPLCLRWTGAQKRNEDSSMRTSLTVSNACGGQHFQLNGVRTVENLGLPSQTINARELSEKFPHLSEIPLQSYQNAKPTILIGSDNWNLAVPLKVKEGRWNEPIATKTRLGWSIQGGSAEFSTGLLNIHACDCEREYRELHELVKGQFQLDHPVKSSIMSADDQRAMNILDQTCRRDSGRFSVGLLWRYDNVRLPDSFAAAYNRAICLQKRCRKDPNMNIILQKKVNNLLEKGYAHKLAENEVNENKEHSWYLPIFTTSNPNKPGKVRLVWDAAARTGSSSLNDFLVSGPDLLNSLFEILLGFRVGRIAISGDIEEMFHQIRVRDADVDAQRFLWCEENNAEPSVYIMRALSFGLSCAPCIAHYVRNKNAEEFRQQFPRAAEAITRSHYMDDYIDSGETELEVLELAKSVKQIHAAAGFYIRNWVSNSKRTVQELDDNLTTSAVHLGNSEKVLGVYWDPQRDLFKYMFKFARLKRNVLSNEINPTKRELLQVMMSLFDPLGFLAIHVVALKILLQEVWRAGIAWDQELPENLLNKWYQWKTAIPKIAKMEIPRWFSTQPSESQVVQIHVFADASEFAYAAAAYLRVQTGTNVEVRLVAAKSKVAPLKPISVPRLELQAALMATRLLAQILQVPRIKVSQKTLWTDSVTVLKWLRMDPRTLKQFVMFRVAEVLDNTNVGEWKWVPSKMNPADLATKADPKTNDELWLSGPPFLREEASNWPHREDLVQTEVPEMREQYCHVHHAALEESKSYADFSCWRRLYRAAATFLLFVDRLKASKSKAIRPDKINYDHIQNAKHILIRDAQLSEFNKEIHCLSLGKSIEKNSKLIGFDLYLDTQRLLRIKSRAYHLTTYNVVVLPHKHHVTFLTVKSMHEKYHHLYPEAVVNEIKGRYYIPKLRVLHRKVKSLCQFCKNRDATPRFPQMASLPKSRLTAFERPFTHVGIDYFGPMFVTVGRRREKRWGVLFTCLTVRAIHIEIAHSLDTASCILCLRNFTSRRGVPRAIYTDNGTNFKATARSIKNDTNAIDYHEIQIKYDDIEWKFNPPAAPHMGGAWERLVRSVKDVLKNLQPSSNFTDETIRSALLEVEFIINSRPLTFVSLDSDDDEALTPNHLLLGSAGGLKPIGDPNDNLKHRHRMTQVYADHFWRRWVKEYGPTLARRGKWFVKQAPLKPGDVVVVVDQNLPRNAWPKGVIVEVTKANDGQVRRARVKTNQGVLERPAAKLAVLDVGVHDGKRTTAGDVDEGGNVADA